MLSRGNYGGSYIQMLNAPVSKRDRFGALAPYAVAFVGVLLVGVFSFELASYRERDRYEQYRTNQYADRAVDDLQKTCAGQPPLSQIKCIAQAIESSNEQQRAERDLSAQENMVRWAALSVAVSFISVILSILGIYWIVRNFGQSAEALSEARKANVMSALFSASEQSARHAELRAYICVTNAEKIPERTDERRYCAVVQFQNFGQTPAYDVVIRRGMQIFDRGVVEEDDYGIRSTVSTDPTVVGPTQSFQASISVDTTEDDLLRLKSGEGVIILFGEVEYVDVAKQQRSTFFNLSIVSFGTADERLVPRGKLNDAT